ncbi:hypothetical protein LEP1GSC041_0031 [Leptospira noguchii str. 2006001870]|uniref:Uncharacterized protein n=1 Tax=Leptospira noguchii serovar Autumnalis str. ZUN142 TaxID=1085540 RepID=M6UX43_9LEPT|nr:hypothetical protein LEP1GSC041_0031 [Leptospira noguchii str. 2006001870]EMO41878.1 hypothetical protein LEP1GSC186_4769 [Leptospira noguchii serovar Autumnalis str. ZUN142]
MLGNWNFYFIGKNIYLLFALIIQRKIEFLILFNVSST